MPIQFLCDNCRRKIEVDDEFLGQEAQCPYCESIVRVIAPPPPPQARPVSPESERPGGFAPRYEPPPPLPPSSPYPSALSEARDGRRRTARRLAWMSLLLGLLGSGLMLLSGSMLAKEASQFIGDDFYDLSSDDQREIMEAFQKHLETAPNVGSILLASVGGMLSTLTGLILGIVSLSAHSRQNVLGWIGVMVAGAWVGLLLIAFLSSAVG